MTAQQIEKLNYCQNHLKSIEAYKKLITFNNQKYGCSSGAPNIEHDLEKIHKQMYKDIMSSFDNATKSIQSIIDEI